jgi:hypothetical protein
MRLLIISLKPTIIHTDVWEELYRAAILVSASYFLKFRWGLTTPCRSFEFDKSVHMYLTSEYKEFLNMFFVILLLLLLLLNKVWGIVARSEVKIDCDPVCLYGALMFIYCRHKSTVDRANQQQRHCTTQSSSWFFVKCLFLSCIHLYTRLCPLHTFCFTTS